MVPSMVALQHFRNLSLCCQWPLKWLSALHVVITCDYAFNFHLRYFHIPPNQFLSGGAGGCCTSFAGSFSSSCGFAWERGQFPSILGTQRLRPQGTHISAGFLFCLLALWITLPLHLWLTSGFSPSLQMFSTRWQASPSFLVSSLHMGGAGFLSTLFPKCPRAASN